jgi:hypothetical protein
VGSIIAEKTLFENWMKSGGLGSNLLETMMTETIGMVLDRIEAQQVPLEFPPNGMSIDLLRAVYRSPSIPLPVRLRAAIAALPHEVPRLAVTALVNEQSFAELLDKRIKRMEAMNGKPQPQIIEQTIDQPIEAPKPLPRVADRRFRRF